MKNVFLYLILFSSFLVLPFSMHAQSGFVRADGKRIVDQHGNNLLLRGIGTGNWMLQEGYMMLSSGVAGTQWEFKKKLTATIGKERTDEFYNSWWDNHFTRADVEAMSEWGFNSVRVALHYKTFTLPIEDEPVQGQDTWLEDGFVRIDSLLQWCEDNTMYLILDMHGCPGGQGANADISDYDPSKPSLWESAENKRKLIALWRKLAERYANKKWMAGYDVINETNWNQLKANNNRDLWNILKDITSAIREVDKNHLIFLSGNDWGNDYNGLPAMWDDNLAISFHKYWNYTNYNSIAGLISLRDQHNVPLWLGETGENSNTWFAEVVKLCEENNIGWSWWPVKKTGINNILRSTSNSDYDAMISAWRNNRSFDAERAYRGVMQFAEAHKFENCIVQYDVIDALITRPHTNETRPFKPHTPSDIIYAVDYDMGNNGVAYFDNDDVNIYLSEPDNNKWNQGWAYRNDGVDIESCRDNPNTNGYAVGWIQDNEWLKYTVTSTETKSYSIRIRHASQSSTARIYIEINGQRASQTIDLPPTGNWSSWTTTSIPNVIMPSGSNDVKIVFERGGANFNYFEFRAPKDVSDTPFQLLSSQTDTMRDEIILSFSKDIDSYSEQSFIVKANNSPLTIKSIIKDNQFSQTLRLVLEENIFNSFNLNVSYNPSFPCSSGTQTLNEFTNFNINNVLGQHFIIPDRIEVEDYTEKSGFQFETCEDIGGGLNAGYTESGNYLDYILYAHNSGEHIINLRASVNTSTARIGLYDAETNKLLKNVSLSRTGGWQSWKTFSSTVTLKEGKNLFRLYAITDGFNLNWFELEEAPGTGLQDKEFSSVFIYPNPVKHTLYIDTSNHQSYDACLYDISGKKVVQKKILQKTSLDVSNYHTGIYFLCLTSGKENIIKKVIVANNI